MDKFVKYCVGQKYDKIMPGDGAKFEINDNRGYINIGLADMTEKEVNIIHEGQLDIYLSVIENIIFITAKFGDTLIFNMPFNAGLYPKFDIENPAPYGYLVPIIAVDNRTNIIKALRLVGFDPDFSAKLYYFAAKQWATKIVNYDERLNSVYTRYTPYDIIDCAVMKNRIRRINE